MQNRNKVVRLGTIDRIGDVFAEIKFSVDGNKTRLSICGVEGPLRNGDARGGCGQIEMSYRKPEERDRINLAPEWTREMLDRFFEVWRDWHLNDMRAGTIAQTRFLREHEAEAEEHRLDHYTWALAALTKAGLNPDMGLPHTCKPDGKQRFYPSQVDGFVYQALRSQKKDRRIVDETDCLLCGRSLGYVYGSAWLQEDIPADVMAFLGSLPETDKTPAWV